MTADIDLELNDEITELSANVDDMTAEEIGYAFDRLLEAGAVDVYALPAVMKKNRPGTILNVLCREDKKQDVIRAMFKHTRTIGIREKLMSRYILKREFETIETPDGDVNVKHVFGYGTSREKLEYDDLAAIASKRGISIAEARQYAESFRKQDK